MAKTINLGGGLVGERVSDLYPAVSIMPTDQVVVLQGGVVKKLPATSFIGPGVAAGGTTGQVLAKQGAGDFDTEWFDINTLYYNKTQSDAAYVKLANIGDGLTNTGGVISLGGTITQSVTLDLAPSTNFDVVDGANGTVDFFVAAGDPTGGGQALISLTSTKTDNTKSSNLQISSLNFSLVYHPTNHIGITTGIDYNITTANKFIVSDDANHRGLEYKADYSTNYTTRSIPDVNWVNTNFVNLNTVYNDPSFIGSLDWTKITNSPTTISGYGITDFNAVGDARYEQLTNKGIANGYAPLNSSTKIDASFLPSYVSDIVTVATFSALPAPGTPGFIYITADTNFEYRWNAGTSAYIRLVASPGTTDALAEGAVNLYYTNARVATYGDAHYAPISGSGYIQNQNSSAQTAGFWINGVGVINKDNIGTTPTDGLQLVNNTLSVGSQFSPSLVFKGSRSNTAYTITNYINFNSNNPELTWMYNGNPLMAISAPNNEYGGILAVGDLVVGAIGPPAGYGINSSAIEITAADVSGCRGLGITRNNSDDGTYASTGSGIYIKNTYIQSASGKSNDFIINRIETSLGSGTHKFESFQVAGVEKYGVDHNGLLYFGGTAGTSNQIPIVNSGGTAMTWVNSSIYLTTATAASTYQPLLGYTAANDANVVHVTGAETIVGAKTWTSTNDFNNIVSSNSNVGTGITLSNYASVSGRAVWANNYSNGGGETDLFTGIGSAGTVGGLNIYNFNNAGAATLLSQLNGTTGALGVLGNVYQLGTGATLGTAALPWSTVYTNAIWQNDATAINKFAGTVSAHLPAYSSGTFLSTIYNSSNDRFETISSTVHKQITVYNNYEITTGDYYIDCGASIDITVTLPNASIFSGLTYVITNVNYITVVNVTIATVAGQTINNSITWSLGQSNSMTLHSDGGNWFMSAFV